MGYEIFTDGASRGNPGHSGIGIAVYNKDDEIFDEISHYIGTKTNNEAEYTAVIRALEYMKHRNIKDANIFCDSQLLVRQLKGEYKVKAHTLIPLHKQVKKLIDELEDVKFQWIKREENSHADSLANKAIDER